MNKYAQQSQYLDQIGRPDLADKQDKALAITQFLKTNPQYATTMAIRLQKDDPQILKFVIQQNPQLFNLKEKYNRKMIQFFGSENSPEKSQSYKKPNTAYQTCWFCGSPTPNALYGINDASTSCITCGAKILMWPTKSGELSGPPTKSPWKEQYQQMLQFRKQNPELTNKIYPPGKAATLSSQKCQYCGTVGQFYPTNAGQQCGTCGGNAIPGGVGNDVTGPTMSPWKEQYQQRLSTPQSQPQSTTPPSYQQNSSIPQ